MHNRHDVWELEVLLIGTICLLMFNHLVEPFQLQLSQCFFGFIRYITAAFD